MAEYQAVPTSPPGKTLGIVGLVLAFVFAPAGIVVSAIAMSQSKGVGFKNTPAKAGLILGIIFTVLAVAFYAILISVALHNPSGGLPG